MGDRTIGTCSCHKSPITTGGTIVTASQDTLSEARGVARIGDTVLADCGHTGTIVSASQLTITNGRGTARMGDKTEGCYVATIISASENTLTN